MARLPWIRLFRFLPFLFLVLALPPARAVAVPPGTTLADRQEIVRHNAAEPVSLDPHKVEGDVEFTIINDFFENLIALDDNGTVEPRLAERWEQTHPTRWVFTLRPDLHWSNGSPLTARDMVATWQRLADPATASPYASYLSNMQLLNAAAVTAGQQPLASLGIRALDERRIEILLGRPFSCFMKMLAHPVLVPLPTGLITQWGDKWTQPGKFASSGPFTLQEWVINEKMVGIRNTRYWNDKQTLLDKVTYLPLESETSAFNRYRAGEIDILKLVPETRFTELKKQFGDQMRIIPALGTYYYDINTRKPPFDDARVRLALNLGLDKDIIAGSIMGQGQQPAYTLAPLEISGVKLEPPHYAHWPRQQRIAKARELLSQAGFSEKRPLRFQLLYHTSETNRRLAIAVSSMWKKNLGVETVLANQEWKSMLDNAHTGNFDVVSSGWYADYSDPSTFLNNFHSKDSRNFAGYASADFDASLEKAAMSNTEAEAATYNQRAEDILAADVPCIPVFYRVNVRLVKPYIGGFHEDRLGYINTKDLYVIAH